jgi:hypothetical protein
MQQGKLEHHIAFEVTRSDIARRLRRVCDGFCEEEFNALVSRMAEIDVRYRLRNDWSLHRLGGPENQHVMN